MAANKFRLEPVQLIRVAKIETGRQKTIKICKSIRTKAGIQRVAAVPPLRRANLAAPMILGRSKGVRPTTPSVLGRLAVFADVSSYVRGLRSDAPYCAQCRQPMMLRAVERPAFRPRTDKFVCCGCGLIEKVEWPGEQPRMKQRVGSHALAPIRRAYSAGQ
jgi:hypothetical protein